MKDKKGTTKTNAFQKILDDSNRKPSKIWVDKCSEFCNRLIKSILQDNDIEMYSTYNDGKSVVAERFIRTLNKNTYKYMTSILKKAFIDKLADIVNKYNNAYRKTIKMKSTDVNSSANTDVGVTNNDKTLDLKLVII